jgi:hypothetical protein
MTSSLWLASCQRCGAPQAALHVAIPSPPFGWCQTCNDWTSWDWSLINGHLDPCAIGLVRAATANTQGSVWIQPERIHGAVTLPVPRPRLTAAATLMQQGGHWEWIRKDGIETPRWVSDGLGQT